MAFPALGQSNRAGKLGIRRTPRRRTVFIAVVVILSTSIIALYLLQHHHSRDFGMSSVAANSPIGDDASDKSHEHETNGATSSSPYAYVALLTGPSTASDTSTSSDPANSSHNTDTNNVYFISARLLTYQLLHAPSTRSTTTPPIPIIILTTPDVPASQISRLKRDGATIHPVDYLRAPWIRPLEPRWGDVLAKLRALQLATYEKVLVMDLDTVVLRPLDGVFEDPATEVQKTKTNARERGWPESEPPGHYSMAGIHQLATPHSFPPSFSNGDFQQGKETYINAGFFVVAPSSQLFTNYESVLSLERRFGAALPEQGLLNYVHRAEGNMPAMWLDAKWNVNYPGMGDVEGGVASVQEKWWDAPEELRELLSGLKVEMEVYFDERDKALLRPRG